MKTLWVFGHQLSTRLQGFKQIDKQDDVILMIEARSRSTWKKYHKKKLVLIFAAMRAFADELRTQGYTVDYYKVDSFQQGWELHAAKYAPAQLLYHPPTDYGWRQQLKKWATSVEATLDVVELEEDLFLVPEKRWAELLPDGKSWVMDHVYRTLRRERRVLMEGDQPVGGKFSYDADNRKPPGKNMPTFHPPLTFEPSEQTRIVMEEVEQEYATNPGSTKGFHLPVSRDEAQRAFDHFLEFRLPTFGDYQDAMVEGNGVMSHSLISSALNIGLLDPLEIIQAAEQRYLAGAAPLAAVEGFIRQILGWREYVRGVYLRLMPAYASVNELEHTRPLPSMFWEPERTEMNCLKQCISEVHETGYGHHIQRLMIIGNYANLAGLDPQQVAEWFNVMYTDAHDWVVLPNVLGMALYADGGRMATKPYISSAAYIHKMSNYCSNCIYDPKDKTSDNACPFNALYWNFLARHEQRLSDNPRMTMMYAALRKMTPEQRAYVEQRSAQHYHNSDVQ